MNYKTICRKRQAYITEKTAANGRVINLYRLERLYIYSYTILCTIYI